MPRFPPPNDVAYLMLDGKAVPVNEIPAEEWAQYEQKMLDNMGKGMSDYYSAKLTN